MWVRARFGLPDLGGTTEAEAEGSPQRSPSDVLGVVTLVGILLFSSVAATNVLALPALTEVMQGLLKLFGQSSPGWW